MNERPLPGIEFVTTEDRRGSASDGRAHELGAVQLTVRLRSQTADFRGGLYLLGDSQPLGAGSLGAA
jgi:hypothetical protein